MPDRRITSRQNERIKQAARLHNARDRAEQGRYTIDGIREIGRAIDGGAEVLEAFACDELLASDEARSLVARLEAADVPVWQVDRDLFAKVAYGARHEGLVAIARLREFPLTALKLPADALVAVLVGIEKPGNVGAVLRSADGAGVSAVVVADGGTDLLNPNTIRASLGTVFAVPIAVATGAETLAWLREQGVTIYAARPDAEQSYDVVDFVGPTAIVLGSEAEGLGAEWHARDVRAIKLPMHGAADSLNVSAAAAVLLYDARRQRDRYVEWKPSKAEIIWNRAAMERGGAAPGPGDRALADLLRVHGLTMNGGVFHAVETLDPAEFDAGIAGYRFFGLQLAADTLLRGREMNRRGIDWEAIEPLIDKEYASIIVDDDVLVSAFEEYLARNPADFAEL